MLTNTQLEIFIVTAVIIIVLVPNYLIHRKQKIFKQPPGDDEHDLGYTINQEKPYYLE